MEIYRIIAEALAEATSVENACDFHGPAAPARPTKAKPATPEKVAVMRDRYLHGLALFNRHDASWDADDVPGWRQIGNRSVIEPSPR